MTRNVDSFSYKLKISILKKKKNLRYLAKPYMRYPAKLYAGYPAKSVSGTTLTSVLYKIPFVKELTGYIQTMLQQMQEKPFNIIYSVTQS